VFAPGAVARVLADAGFHAAAEHRQFVLPIALHKAINSEPWTRRIEGVFEWSGLTGLLGSPVTIGAERDEPAAP
jgi:hypothetical protein